MNPLEVHMQLKALRSFPAILEMVDLDGLLEWAKFYGTAEDLDLLAAAYAFKEKWDENRDLDPDSDRPKAILK